MLRLAQELIRIPSFKTEESDVARFLGDYLSHRGWEVQCCRRWSPAASRRWPL